MQTVLGKKERKELNLVGVSFNQSLHDKKIFFLTKNDKILKK